MVCHMQFFPSLKKRWKWIPLSAMHYKGWYKQLWSNICICICFFVCVFKLCICICIWIRAQSAGHGVQCTIKGWYKQLWCNICICICCFYVHSKFVSELVFFVFVLVSVFVSVIVFESVLKVRGTKCNAPSWGDISDCSLTHRGQKKSSVGKKRCIWRCNSVNGSELLFSRDSTYAEKEKENACDSIPLYKVCFLSLWKFQSFYSMILANNFS